MTPRRHPFFQRRIPTSGSSIVSHGLNPPSRTRSRALKKRPLPSTQNGCFPCAVKWGYMLPSHDMWSIECHDAAHESRGFPEMFVLCSTSKCCSPAAPALKWLDGGTLSASM